MTIGFIRNKLLPLEKMYNFHDFHSPSLSDVDFEVLPQVLVIGNCHSLLKKQNQPSL